jgi:hypothetical protein
MDSLNVKNINDEKIFNVIDPNGQGNVETRIRPISISINQKAETINNQTDSTINLAVYWNDTWKSILDLSFDESLRQEYGKLVEDLTKIQKDIDMKQYKDAETKTTDFLKYIANLSSKYTAIPEKAVVANATNDFVSIKAEKNSVTATISDTLLNFMLRKFAKVNNLDVTKANECFSTNNLSCLANHYDLYYHSPEIFQKQAYMTVVKDNKVVGSYKVNYDQFCKFASKFAITPTKLGYSKDKMAGYMKTAEVVMQNIFFDNVDEAKEWQEMVDEKKKETAQTPEGEEETTEIKETETKTEKTIGEEGKTESPVKEEGGLVRPDEGFASDEIPESQPRQQEQQGGGQGMAASRKVNNVKKTAKTVNSKQDIKQFLKDKNAVETRNYGDFVNAIRENKTPVETIKAYSKKKTAGGYDEYVLVVYEGGAYFYTELSNGKRTDEKYYKFENVEKEAENRKNYNVVIGFDGKEEESDFAQEDVISALQEALIYFGETWHELPSSLDNIDKLDFVKIREIEKGETVKEYTKEDILKMKEDFPKYSCKKQALYGDVQEQDIVPAKTETKVYLQSEKEEQTVEEKIEEQVADDTVKGKIGVGDIVALNFDNVISSEDFPKYEEFIGKPMLLMETDKEDINKVIIEETEYPFQRITVDAKDVFMYEGIKNEEVIVEDTDGDEMITSFEELPIVAKQCKIKSIHKAARINKKKANVTKKAVSSLEDVANLIDKILYDYDYYDYADQLEVGETSHYENILADVQKDEKGTIEATFNRVTEDGEEYNSVELEELKKYYNTKFGGK